VEAGDIVLAGQFEAISTSVSVGIFGCESAGGVEWLMDVSNVMDQKSQVEAVSELVRDGPAVGGWLWCLCAFQCADQLSQFPSDVIFVWVPVSLAIPIVEVWVVDEVPVCLVRPALGLDVVSEGGAFDEWVVFFNGGE